MKYYTTWLLYHLYNDTGKTKLVGALLITLHVVSMPIEATRIEVFLLILMYLIYLGRETGRYSNNSRILKEQSYKYAVHRSKDKNTTLRNHATEFLLYITPKLLALTTFMFGMCFLSLINRAPMYLAGILSFYVLVIHVIIITQIYGAKLGAKQEQVT